MESIVGLNPLILAMFANALQYSLPVIQSLGILLNGPLSYSILKS